MYYDMCIYIYTHTYIHIYTRAESEELSHRIKVIINEQLDLGHIN